MEGLQFNIWSILILVAAFNGYLLSIYFITKKSLVDQRLFGLLLLIISLHLTEYACTISRLFITFPHIIAITYPMLFLMGPLFYFHTKKQLGQGIKKHIVWHFIPAIAMFLFMLPFYSQSGEAKLTYYLSSLDLEDPRFTLSQFTFIFLHFLHLSCYVLFSRKLLSTEIVNFKMNQSSNEVFFLDRFNRISKLFLGFIYIFLMMLILMLFMGDYRVEIDYIVVLVLSGIIFYIGYSLLEPPTNLTWVDNGRPKQESKYATSSLNEEKLMLLKERLDKKMKDEKPFLDGELKLLGLAESLNIPSHHLSQLINQAYKTHFFDFVNRYRIEEAKRLLADEKYKNEKIFTIALDSGFNNKASFNRVFKRYTGFSPSQYKSSQLSN